MGQRAVRAWLFIRGILGYNTQCYSMIIITNGLQECYSARIHHTIEASSSPPTSANWEGITTPYRMQEKNRQRPKKNRKSPKICQTKSSNRASGHPNFSSLLSPSRPRRGHQALPQPSQQVRPSQRAAREAQPALRTATRRRQRLPELRRRRAEGRERGSQRQQGAQVTLGLAGWGAGGLGGWFWDDDKVR